MKLINWLKEKHIICTWKEIGEQSIRRKLFGFGEGSLGIRIIYQCKKCLKVKYESLNLIVPQEYVHDKKYQHLWKPDLKIQRENA